MFSKQRSLQRLAALYAVVAEARSYELEVAAMRLHETEMAIAGQQDLVAEASASGRLALHTESSLDRRAAEVTVLAAERGVGVLMERRMVHVNQCEAARAEYVMCRQRSEQMREIVDEMLAEAGSAEVRAEQSRSDDRYVARKHWLSQQRS